VDFQKLKFEPYSPTSNPKWSKHRNFSWTGQNALMPNAQGGFPKKALHLLFFLFLFSSEATILRGELWT